MPRWCLCVLLCLALGACASHEVRCDGILEPINLPTPQSHGGHVPGAHEQ